MKPSWRQLKPIVFLSMFAGIPPFCPAQEVTNQPAAGTNIIPEIVVSASRLPRAIYSEPSTVYRLDAQEMTADEDKRTTPDVLSDIPSVMVQKTSYGQGSPYLRGFTGFRTLMLIEGIRLNNAVFRDGPNQYWNTVDPLSISDYELIMGPVSVLYGSDAIGGLLNAFTIRPPAYADGGAYQPKIYYRGATADRSNVGRLQFGCRPIKEIGFVLGGSLKYFSDLRGGRSVGLQPHTGYAEQDYDGRLDYYINDDSTLTYGHQTDNQDEVWRTHKTIYGIDWRGLAVGNEKVHYYDQKRNLDYIKYKGTKFNAFVDGMEATVSRQAQKEDEYRVKKDNTSDKQGVDDTTLGTALQLNTESQLGEWVYGVEYYHDGVSSYSDKYKANGKFDKSEIQGPVADDSSYDSVGTYVEDTIRFFDGLFDLVPGMRYTYAKADAVKVKDPVSGKQMSIKDDWNALAGSLRLLYPLTADRKHVVFSGVSQGFRAPNLSDLTRLDTARSNEIETPVSDLDPERYIAYEIGLKSEFERFITQLSCYYTTIDDMIVRTPTGRMIDEYYEVTKKNSGHGFIEGIELTETYRLTSALKTWVSGSLMNGKVDAYPNSSTQEEREYISRLMPPTMELGVRWDIFGGKYWMEAVGNAATKADKLSAEDQRDTQRIPPGGTPGYAVLNLRAGTKVLKYLDLTLALENVMNEDYRIHGSGVNEPGRNLVFTAVGTF